MMDGMRHTADAASTSAFGILYAEDFDDPAPDPSADQSAPAEPAEPAITRADVATACADAVRAARLEWQAAQEQMRCNALASLATAVAGARETAEQTAQAIAEGTVGTMLAMLAGMMPHFCREHGSTEVRALLGKLLPTVQSKTRIAVRVHPDLVQTLERDVADLEPDLAGMIDVVAAQLERGDVKVSWENGSLARDTRQIMQAIQDALGLLGLHQPTEAPSKRRMAYAD